MNRAQRATLFVVLAIDALLILFPPFEAQGGYGRIFNRGHHWLLYPLLDGRGATVNVVGLAAEVTIVSIIGFTVFVLAKGVPDERASAVLVRLSAPRRGLAKIYRSVRTHGLSHSWASVLVTVIGGLLLVFIIWLAVFLPGEPQPTVLQANRSDEPAVSSAVPNPAAPKPTDYAGEMLRRQLAEQQAAADSERRKQIAKSRVSIASKSIECKSSTGCSWYQFTLTVLNGSTENLGSIAVGWAFLSPGSSTCPNSYEAKHTSQLNILPGDTATLNITGFDGPSGRGFNYCVGITGVEIQH
jgi:hypothetical protein